MERACQWVERALRALLCVLMAGMTLTVLWQVATRLISKFELFPGMQPSQWTEELAGFQLGWVALLGAAYVYRKRGHLSFDLLYATHSPAAKRRLDLLAYTLEALFCVAVLVVGGLRLVILTFQLGQTTPSLRWPMGAIYLVLPMTGVLMTFFAISFFVRRVKRSAEKPEQSVEVTP